MAPLGSRRPRVGAAAVLAAAAVMVIASCAVPVSPGTPGGDGTVPASGASTAGTVTSSGPAPGDQVRGRTFLSTSVTGHPLVAGSTVTVSFDGGRIVVQAGCNTMSGDVRWDGAHLTAADMAATAMGCAQPLMDQDEWLAGLLRSGMQVELHGDVLTLTGDGVTMQLTDRRVADPDRPLQGTLWRLSGIIEGTGDSGSVSSVPPGITATMRIAQGKIHFFDGLNDYDGPTGPGAKLTVGPDTVTIVGDIGGSAVGCASGSTCSVDMSVLMRDFAYKITAGSLTVTGIGPTSGKGLMFTADDTGTTTTTGPAAGPAGTAGTAPVEPAPTGPAAAPGTVTGLPPAPASPSLPGGHGSIPPQPSPAGPPPVDGSASSAQPTQPARTASPAQSGSTPTAAELLVGKSFRLTGLFTDAGGVDTKDPDKGMIISFAAGGADADTSCGHIVYPTVRYYSGAAGPMVDLGEPTGATCSFGSDPAGPPAGQLMVVMTGRKLFLSTGFVGWWFEPAG